ncbi:MAG: 3'-5' exonuclease [Candidatus Protistobacter heckmanni]|nr:3'-5' exonuclease [Candidatus Protistobacter heckmanni]
MTPVLVFDIETIPDVAGIRRLHGLNDSLTDAEAADVVFAEREAKTGGRFLPHYMQKIVAISCVLRKTAREGGATFHVGSLGEPESGEAELVEKFFALIEKYTPQLVSWNGSGFDLPVLHYRAMVNGIEASRYWDMGEGNGYDSRDFKWNNYISRYHMRHLDLMDLLASYQARAYAPLDDLAKLCGFPGKMGMDGSQVWQAWQEGKIGEIRQYCETDVVNTYLLYCRFQLMRGGFSRDEYEEEIAFVKKSMSGMDGPQWQGYLAAFADAKA